MISAKAAAKTAAKPPSSKCDKKRKQGVEDHKQVVEAEAEDSFHTKHAPAAPEVQVVVPKVRVVEQQDLGVGVAAEPVDELRESPQAALQTPPQLKTPLGASDKWLAVFDILSEAPTTFREHFEALLGVGEHKLDPAVREGFCKEAGIQYREWKKLDPMNRLLPGVPTAPAHRNPTCQQLPTVGGSNANGSLASGSEGGQVDGSRVVEGKGPGGGNDNAGSE